MHALLAGAALAVLAAAPALAADPIIDNERVTVWDVTLNPGETGPATPPGLDMVILYAGSGQVRSTTADGKATTTARGFGDAAFAPRGAGVRDTLVSGGPLHEVVVALKNTPVTPPTNTARLPPAFPRPGSVKRLENARVVVWNYAWTSGRTTPMHFHDKDVVLTYRYDGELQSTTPTGEKTLNAFKAGDVRFNRSNRAHSELLLSARAAAVMVELK